MFLPNTLTYDLKLLSKTKNFWNLCNIHLNKKEFKTKGDCWFTIVEFSGCAFYEKEYKIEITSTKSSLKQRLNDYMKAYTYLISNKFVRDIELSISHNGMFCEITFNN